MNLDSKISPLTRSGTGQPFIWLHGMLQSVESDSVYSLIDFDKISAYCSLIRYNYCNKSVLASYTWPDLCDELVQVANSITRERLILGGLSMGAGTILHFATQYPERVKAMVLVTPPPAWEMRTETIKVYNKIVAKTNSKAVPEILKRIIEWNRDPPDFYEQQHQGTRQKIQNLRLSFEPQYYTQIYSGGAHSDFPSREQISKIDVPTLIVTLPGDANHPIEMAQELNKLIKGSDLHVINSYMKYQELQNIVFDFLSPNGIDNKS